MMEIKELSDFLWTGFLAAALVWIWLYKPSLPQGSGRTAIWIRYHEQPRKWRFYAYLITACILGLGGVMAVLNFAK